MELQRRLGLRLPQMSECVAQANAHGQRFARHKTNSRMRSALRQDQCPLAQQILEHITQATAAPYEHVT